MNRPAILIKQQPKGVVDIFRQLAHHDQKCVILVTHSHAVAAAADEVMILQNGQLVAHGEAVKDKVVKSRLNHPFDDDMP